MDRPIQPFGYGPDAELASSSSQPALPAWLGHSWSSAPLENSQASHVPEHIVTIFMDDHRDEAHDPESSLAEIPMPIRFDTDANAWCIVGDDLAIRLQQTPSRIDGHAKLCTMRGRYKQCFARITDSMVERSLIPVGLKLEQNKSLKITVEPNPVPAARTASLPPADQLLGLGKRGSETRPGQMLPTAKKTTNSPPPTSPFTQSTTPPPTPGPPRTNEFPAWRVAEGSRDNTSASSSASSVCSSQTYTEPIRTHKSKPNRPKDPKPEVNAVIVSWLRTRFAAEDPQSFSTFIHSKGKSLPVQDLLRGYRYAAKLIAEYNDTRTPSDLEGAPDRKISKANIFSALGRQTSWGSDTETTLALVDLYGPGGQREDAKIVAIMAGNYSGAKEGSVGFLHSLKEADKEFASKSGGGGASQHLG